MKQKKWLVSAVVAVSLLTMGGGAFAATQAHHGAKATGSGMMGSGNSSSSSGNGNGMMGSGSSSSSSGSGMMGSGSSQGYGSMMGSGMMADHASLDSRAQLNQWIQQGKSGVVIDRNSNTITYSGKTGTLVVMASPHGEPNMTWEMDGLVNPTIVIPAKATIQVLLANTDWGFMHGFEVSATPPPYAYMSMMDVNSDFLLMPVPERTTQNVATARYYTRSGYLHLRPGTYHYLCPMPGHAQQGMYGTLKIV